MNPEKWTPDDVAAHLYDIGLGKYGPAFVSNKISGKLIFSLNDKQLQDLGFNAANKRTFNSWVTSLYKPRSNRAIDAGRRIASPKTISGASLNSTTRSPNRTTTNNASGGSPNRRTGQLSSSQNVSNRLFQGSLQKKKPSNDNVAYVPRITGAMRYGGQVDDSFDIRDLMFVPGPQLKELPKRILPPSKRRRTKFEVPEDGDMDHRGTCHYCGRRFAMDRLPVHESICARSRTRSRRPFNSQKQRLAGTGTYGTKNAPKRPPPRRPGEKPKYVQEHEELVRLLRAARRAEGGGAVRMPPPKVGPDDRVQCPYCGRRFGQNQAERHMRFCEGNKPPPRGPMTTSKVARGGRYRYK